MKFETLSPLSVPRLTETLTMRKQTSIISNVRFPFLRITTEESAEYIVLRKVVLRFFPMKIEPLTDQLLLCGTIKNEKEIDLHNVRINPLS